MTSAPDPAVLRGLLDRLSAERADLARFAALAPGQLADVDRLKAVKYTFVVAAEVCIDVCHHVIAARGLRAPASFADGFSVLAENGMLDGELAVSLGDLARFRNLLVHGYADVDDGRVLDILRTRVVDLDAFSRVAAGFG